jgi:hypothetical protein
MTAFIEGARVRVSEDAPAFGGLEGEVAVPRESVSDVRLDAGKTVPVQTAFLEGLADAAADE